MLDILPPFADRDNRPGLAIVLEGQLEQLLRHQRAASLIICFVSVQPLWVSNTQDICIFIVYPGHSTIKLQGPIKLLLFPDLELVLAHPLNCTSTYHQKESYPPTRMPLRPSIDDTNTTLIEYKGEWEVFTDGSSRQWSSSVHSTLQLGASATFRFQGYQVWVWATTPIGTGSNLIDFSIDGGSPTTVSRSSNASAVYNDQYYVSQLMSDSDHEIVVTNRGSQANGNTEFQLDRFEFETAGNEAVFPTLSTTSSSITPTQTSSTDTTQPSSSGSKGSKTPLGAILGSVIGVLVFFVLVLSFLLWRRRRKNIGSAREASGTDNRRPFHAQSGQGELGQAVTPFPVQTSSLQSALEAASQRPEKAIYHASPQQPIAVIPSTTNTAFSIHDTLRAMPSSTSLGTTNTSLLPSNIVHPDALAVFPPVTLVYMNPSTEPLETPPSYFQHEQVPTGVTETAHH